MAPPEAVDAPMRPDDATEETPIVADEVEAVPRRRFWRKRTTIVVTVAVVAAGAGAGIGIWLGTSSSSTPLLEVTTQVVTVTTGTMKQTVSASGTIEPAQQANLNFAVSGKITAVNVSAGQTVTAGQALATVDPSALQAQADAAQASLTAAQSKLSTDESDGASSSQIASDEASVTSAQSQLTTAQTNLADASLTSTITGTVASVGLSMGQQVSGTSSSSSGSSGGSSSSSGGGSTSSASSANSSSSSSSGQVVVISTGSFVVSSTVDDTQVGEVKAGDQVDITPSGSTTTVYGTVTSVGLIASTSSTVATFPVDITVTGSPGGLFAGSSATLSIIVKQLNNVVEVPTAAISYSGGQSTATVVENGSHVSRSIITGVSSSGDTQVTNGLTAGEKVLERVVTFNGVTSGSGRSLFGGSTSGSSGGFPRGGGFARSGGSGG